jgi:hypothetical protein
LEIDRYREKQEVERFLFVSQLVRHPHLDGDARVVVLLLFRHRRQPVALVLRQRVLFAASFAVFTETGKKI